MKVLTSMQTEPFLAERTWTAEGVPVLWARVDLPRPVSEPDSVSRRIRRYYNAQYRAFFRYCEHVLLPQATAALRQALAGGGGVPDFRAELTHRVTCNEGGLWSLYTQSRETTAEGTLVVRRGDTWDLQAGYPVPLSAFFPPHTPWKRRLLARAEEELHKQAGTSRFHETWRRELRRHFNSRNYYLTPEALCLFYPMFALGPAAAGIPVFTVPLGAEETRWPQAAKNGTN